MRLFAIYGQDGIYGGLHGMRYEDVIEVNNRFDAEDEAEDLAMYVITSYHDIINSLEEDIEAECELANVIYGNGTEVEEDIREHIYYEDCEYGVVELDKNLLPTLDAYILDEMLQKESWDEFINKYELKEEKL